MRKLISLIFVIVFSLPVFSQKVIKREIDKFSKVEVVETNSNRLFTQNKRGTGFSYIFECSIRRVGDVYSMPASILTDDIEKYTEDSGVTFLFANGDILKLYTNYTGISDPKEFGNGHWFNTSFSLTPEQVELLKNNKIEAIRISYLGGYYDHDIKDKNQDKIMKMIKLVE